MSIFVPMSNLEAAATDRMVTKIVNKTGFHINNVSHVFSMSNQLSSEYHLEASDGKRAIIVFEHWTEHNPHSMFDIHNLSVYVKWAHVIWGNTYQNVTPLADDVCDVLQNLEEKDYNGEAHVENQTIETIINAAIKAGMKDVVSFQWKAKSEFIVRMKNAQDNHLFAFVQYNRVAPEKGLCSFATGEADDCYISVFRSQKFRTNEKLLGMFNDGLFCELMQM